MSNMNRLVLIQVTQEQLGIINRLVQTHIDIDKDQIHDEKRGPGYWEEVQNLADCSLPSNYNESPSSDVHSWVL